MPSTPLGATGPCGPALRARRSYQPGSGGPDELGTGWTPAWIDAAQAEELLAFLRREVVNPAGYELIPALERRLAVPGRPTG